MNDDDHALNWEQAYQQGQTPWDKGQPSPPLRQWLQRHALAGRVLVPGCGLGHDVALLHAEGADAHGLDLAPSAIRLGLEAHPELVGRLHLGDLWQTPEDWQGSVDAVVERTCFCALPPGLRARYEAVIHGLLKPAGLLIGVWFIHPQMDPGEQGPPFALPLPELESLFAPPRWQVLEDSVPDCGYEGRVGRERLRVLRRLEDHA